MAGRPSVTDPLSFFTIDRGTASVAVALIAPVDGRFRLLAASAMPASVELETVLADLVARVRSVEPSWLPYADRWPSWIRLEVATAVPSRVVCAAGSRSRGAGLAGAFAGAGWDVDVRSVAGRPARTLPLSHACLDRTVDVLVVAAGDPPSSDERAGLQELITMLGPLAGRRDDLRVVLAGGAAGYEHAFPPGRVTRAPAPRPVEGRSGTPLHAFAAELIGRRAAVSAPPDGHAAYRASIASLASLLGRPVDAVDIGRSSGSRVSVAPDGPVGWMTRADGALVPLGGLDDEAQIEGILHWGPLASDDPDLQDRIRELALHPWRDTSDIGTRLRATALRAASTRLAQHWLRSARSDAGSDERRLDGDVLVVSGGALAAVPVGIAAVALLDAFRRPGMLRMVWDHARILAPLGAIATETDRRRLLADLMDDALIPLGSALVLADGRPSRKLPMVSFQGALTADGMTVTAGSLMAIDLPPGLVARAALRDRAPLSFRRRPRPATPDAWGGLAGLMVDGRPVPLRLPEGGAARRALFEDWERPFWPAAAAPAGAG